MGDRRTRMIIEQVMVLQLDREEVMMIETVLISKTVGGQEAIYQAIKYKRRPIRMIPIMLLVNTLGEIRSTKTLILV